MKFLKAHRSKHFLNLSNNFVLKSAEIIRKKFFHQVFTLTTMKVREETGGSNVMLCKLIFYAPTCNNITTLKIKAQRIWKQREYGKWQNILPSQYNNINNKSLQFHFIAYSRAQMCALLHALLSLFPVKFSRVHFSVRNEKFSIILLHF